MHRALRDLITHLTHISHSILIFIIIFNLLDLNRGMIIQLNRFISFLIMQWLESIYHYHIATLIHSRMDLWTLYPLVISLIVFIPITDILQRFLPYSVIRVLALLLLFQSLKQMMMSLLIDIVVLLCNFWIFSLLFVVNNLPMLN